MKKANEWDSILVKNKQIKGTMTTKIDIKNDLNFSTRTMIAELNYNINIKKLFDSLPIYHLLKEYGRTHICYMYDKHNSKGDVTKKKKKSKKKKKKEEGPASVSPSPIKGCPGPNIPVSTTTTTTTLKSFRNSLNLLVESNSGRILTIKAGRLGRFHITGARNEEECYSIIKYLVELILTSNKDIFVFSSSADRRPSDSLLRVRFLTIMTNYIWNINFKIDKEKLNTLLNNQSDFINLYETSFGYTGVNVKKEINIEKYQNKIETPIFVYNQYENTWSRQSENRQKFGKDNRPKHNTFLVFNSGKIIVSGIQEEIMQSDFDLFSSFLLKNRHHIEEFLIY